MPTVKTRLERAEELLKREQHKSDLRRLRKAYDHLDAALAELNLPFYEQANTDIRGDIFDALNKHDANPDGGLMGTLALMIQEPKE
jgi:hypothetical protein